MTWSVPFLKMNSTTDITPPIHYTNDLTRVDWSEMKASLAADEFDNGRSAEQLRRSFENSHSACIAYAEGRIVGTARVLSDGVCNAYLLDVWTASPLRRRGIAREMIRRLCAGLAGQHVYLQADERIAEVYRRLGFREQPIGMSLVVGRWLVDSPV